MGVGQMVLLDKYHVGQTVCLTTGMLDNWYVGQTVLLDKWFVGQVVCWTNGCWTNGRWTSGCWTNGGAPSLMCPTKYNLLQFDVPHQRLFVTV